jgi:8-oxo-dGTP diphosphatase
MKKAIFVGNVTILLDVSAVHNEFDPVILLGRKKPKGKDDDHRKRKRIGIGRWVPPGGATELDDKSQKHSAQRELQQETGLSYPLRKFKKVGVLRGYVDSGKTFNWLVNIYLVNSDRPQRALKPNEEYVKMHWFHLSKLPFNGMLRGDREWLPRIVRGEKLSIRIVRYGSIDRPTSITITPIKSFN